LDSEPDKESRVAVLDGEKSNPTGGVFLEADARGYTLWGELAFRLGGMHAFHAFVDSDRQRKAPSPARIRELFEDCTALILVDR